jgi:hypothetical protein
VAQEEIERITTPPIRTAIHIDLMLNLLLNGPSQQSVFVVSLLEVSLNAYQHQCFISQILCFSIGLST